MANLLGSWKLLEARAFDRAGNELEPPLGETPMGLVHFEAGRIGSALGRMTTMVA